MQTEGVLHLCLDCGYKLEDTPQTDLGEMIIYQSDDGVKLDVRLENKTVWLNVEQIAELFNKGRSTINEHILNIFKEGELDEKWFVGNSDRPLSMVPWQENPKQRSEVL